MPRPRRFHRPGALYHVILRGNHRQRIFHDDSQLEHFGRIVADAVDRCSILVHAFCWMPNHVHLAVQAGAAPIGPAMLRIASRHARHVQRRIPTTGHLFERRYRALLVDEQRYLLELVRYIHLNPVRAGLVADPQDYAWSSHGVYLGERVVPWVTTQPTLRLFGRGIAEARKAYFSFVCAGIGVEPPDVLRSGLTADEVEFDAPAADGATPTTVGGAGSGASAAIQTLDELVERVCADAGVSMRELTGPSRGVAAARARALIAYEAVRTGVASISDVARRLGRSKSTVSEAVTLLRSRGATRDRSSDGTGGLRSRTPGTVRTNRTNRTPGTEVGLRSADPDGGEAECGRTRTRTGTRPGAPHGAARR